MMTKHPENLVAWLDDELTADQAEVVTRHVEGCAECRAKARSYAAVGEGLMELRARPERVSWRRWSVAAAGIAAAVLVAVGMWVRPSGSVVALPVVVAPPRAQEMQMFFRASAPPVAVVRVRAVRKKAAPVPVVREVRVPVSLSMDEYLPPGAIPAGYSIRAEMVLAEDGTARELRLMP